MTSLQIFVETVCQELIKECSDLLSVVGHSDDIDLTSSPAHQTDNQGELEAVHAGCGDTSVADTTSDSCLSADEPTDLGDLSELWESSSDDDADELNTSFCEWEPDVALPCKFELDVALHTDDGGGDIGLNVKKVYMNIANSSSSVYESDYPDEHEELPTERHRRKIRVKHVDDGSMSRNIHIRHSPYRLLPQKRKREADESETSLPQKRTRWAPFPESSSSESDSGSSKSCSDSDCSCSDSDCVSMTDSDEDEGREIDLRYEASPCPGGCPCRPGYRPLPVVHGIERLKPVTVPLYKRFLQYKLLNIFNTCFNQCCDCMCQRRWTQRDRRSLRRIMADY